jgi:hypothetical protein
MGDHPALSESPPESEPEFFVLFFVNAASWWLSSTFVENN